MFFFLFPLLTFYTISILIYKKKTLIVVSSQTTNTYFDIYYQDITFSVKLLFFNDKVLYRVNKKYKIYFQSPLFMIFFCFSLVAGLL